MLEAYKEKMRSGDIIIQEKSNEELSKLADAIIVLLKDCNIVEKYKVVTGLQVSLLDIIKEHGIIIEQELAFKGEDEN